MTLTDPEDRARSLLEEQGINYAPVPVHEIAESQGIEVSYDHFDGDVSGMLFRKDALVAIGINSSHSPTRQRFTLAHELGHFLLHDGRPVIVDKSVRINYRDERSSLATDSEEIQANQFAAELLMPRNIVFDEVIKAHGSADDIDEDWFVDELAQQFDVSRQAMEYRLINLGLRSPK